MTTSLQQPTMNEFYHSFSLVDYPFNLYTAENELPYLTELFVHPLNYDAIKSSFVGNRSIIIRGNRGTGKTALLLDLQNNTTKNHFACVIDDYSDLPLSPTVHTYYELILTNIVSTLFNKLFGEKERLKKLNKDDKLLLCYENNSPKRAQQSSHLTAGHLHYELARSGGAWNRIRFPAKCFQSFQITVYLPVTVKGIIVISAVIAECHLFAENVVYGNKHGVRHRECRTILPTSGRNSLVLC